MGVSPRFPSRHPLLWDFPLKTIQLWGYPQFRKPPYLTGSKEVPLDQHGLQGLNGGAQSGTGDRGVVEPRTKSLLQWSR